MQEDIERALEEFFRRHQGIGLFSTGSRVVDYDGVLYNVEGSSDDPRIDGAGWKRLLQNSGIDGDCYVTHPLPDQASTHAQFNVGGHMTPDDEGYVQDGGICYLMPLCHWHNNPGRNRTPFEHTSTRMLELSGYMEGDLAATFVARMPGDAEFRLVGVDGDALISRAIDAPPPMDLDARRDTGAILPRYFILLRQVTEGGSLRFVIEDARLPGGV